MAKEKKPLTQAQFVDAVVEQLGGKYERKDVKKILAGVTLVAVRQLKKGAGKCTIPELAVQVKVVKKAATKAREGRNPATGETITISAKPARKVVKALPMKKFKDMVL